MDVAELEREAREADAEMQRGRARLVAAVRRAQASGMSQRQIAAHSNRSQPEIARLLRFHGTSPHGRVLRAKREALLAALAEHGIGNVRVFGSTARGTDRPDSDVDLLVVATEPIGLLTQARIQAQVSDLLDIPVDLVFDDAIRPDLATRILTEAVPL